METQQVEEPKQEPSTVTVDGRTYYENQLLGYAVTLRNVKEVRWQSGKEVLVDPPEQDFMGFPKKFRDSHSSAINKIMITIDAFEEEKRDLPLSRTEAIEVLGIEKQVIKDLDRFGFIQTTNLNFRDKTSNKNLGPRQVILLTAQGLALHKMMKQALADTIVSPT